MLPCQSHICTMQVWPHIGEPLPARQLGLLLLFLALICSSGMLLDMCVCARPRYVDDTEDYVKFEIDTQRNRFIEVRALVLMLHTFALLAAFTDLSDRTATSRLTINWSIAVPRAA